MRVSGRSVFTIAKELTKAGLKRLKEGNKKG